MTEFEVAGHKFRADGLAPKKAFHVMRRLAPVLGGLREAIPVLVRTPDAAPEGDDEAAFERAASILEPLAEAVAKMPEDDANYVIDTCLAAVQVEIDSGRGWAPVQAGGHIMFDWITMPIMFQIVWSVIQQNLSGFFPAGASA